MKIALIGLGYVGLPLAVAFAEKFKIVGIDTNQIRIDELEKGHDKTLEVEDALLSLVKDNIIYTSDIKDAKDCNIYIVTVPTPIDDTNEPDLTAIIKSTESIGRILNKDDIVIYESTVYPGVTEEVCAPILEKESGLKFNKTFFCGYSPERINPGDKKHTVTKILKITSGSTPEIAVKIDDLYKTVITAGTYLAPTIKVAEAAKVIENTQRDVNIALMNEFSMIFDLMSIDTNAVLSAAGTKWNFIKFTPGLVGGHCIGVDPYYLTYKAQLLGYTPNLILSARQINNGMSKLIADKAIKHMVKNNKKLNGANVLILGMTFKENCPDIRNTKVIDIVTEIKEYQCNVEVYDYWVDESDKKSININFINTLPYGSNKYDSIIVAVGHDKFKEITTEEYAKLSNGTPIIIDVKGIVENSTWRL
jgi:UDP-N-acetyl-D-glucosamine/UDP-N-acetyl-D-galactosamine dehydrogenase